MNTLDVKKINIVTKNLESFIKEGQRRLFEFETMKNLYELQQGNFKLHKSAGALMKSLDSLDQIK